MVELPEMLRVKDCAANLKITPIAFYRMLKGGTGPRAKRVGKGRSIRIPLNSYLEWLNAEPKLPRKQKGKS